MTGRYLQAAGGLALFGLSFSACSSPPSAMPPFAAEDSARVFVEALEFARDSLTSAEPRGPVWISPRIFVDPQTDIPISDRVTSRMLDSFQGLRVLRSDDLVTEGAVICPQESSPLRDCRFRDDGLGMNIISLEPGRDSTHLFVRVEIMRSTIPPDGGVLWERDVHRLEMHLDPDDGWNVRGSRRSSTT